MENGLLDWKFITSESKQGRLLPLLLKLPRTHWAQKNQYGQTILHYAVFYQDKAATAAICASKSVDVNALCRDGVHPIHFAISFEAIWFIEILLAAGTNVMLTNRHQRSLLQCSLNCYTISCSRMLIANGARLRTIVKPDTIRPELYCFEHNVLNLRSNVVALLRVKKAGNLWRWDKFLLKEIAISVWSTRYECL